jgi:hypothetical protein
MSKPQPKTYYDIHDLKKYYNLDSIRDFLYKDDYLSNGQMIHIYKPYFDDIDNDEDRLVSERRKMIYDEFGEIEVKVWW